MNSIYEVRDLYDKAYVGWKHKPDPTKYTHYSEDYIFDEDKSVKWNREQVKKFNREYEAEAQRLRSEEIAARKEADDAIMSYIIESTASNTRYAELLWDYVYDRYHSDSTGNLFYELDEIIELANSLLAAASTNEGGD